MLPAKWNRFNANLVFPTVMEGDKRHVDVGVILYRPDLSDDELSFILTYYGIPESTPEARSYIETTFTSDQLEAIGENAIRVYGSRLGEVVRLETRRAPPPDGRPGITIQLRQPLGPRAQVIAFSDRPGWNLTFGLSGFIDYGWHEETASTRRLATT